MDEDSKATCRSGIRVKFKIYFKVLIERLLFERLPFGF